MASCPIASWQIEREEAETVTAFIFLAPNHCRWWLQCEIKRCSLLGRKAMTDLDSVLKSRDITLPTKVHYGFASSHVWIWDLKHKKGWGPKNWCFQIVVLEETLESPLDSKDIKPVDLKGNQPWMLIIRTDAEAEASILWSPDVKN